MFIIYRFLLDWTVMYVQHIASVKKQRVHYFHLITYLNYNKVKRLFISCISPIKLSCIIEFQLFSVGNYVSFDFLSCIRIGFFLVMMYVGIFFSFIRMYCSAWAYPLRLVVFSRIKEKTYRDRENYVIQNHQSNIFSVIIVSKYLSCSFSFFFRTHTTKNSSFTNLTIRRKKWHHVDHENALKCIRYLHDCAWKPQFRN